MAINSQGKTNIPTPDLGWSILYFDTATNKWCYKKDDGTVKCLLPTDEETVTSLGLNANILKYTDELGVETDIDLSLYLDDTNLARLVSGTINPSTGIATFTRDDASTFNVDFSSLIDIETITTLTESPAGIFTYTSEDSTQTIIDISNFETSTQLDSRDTANRARANHTGTQLAATISDFAAAVTANETNTILQLIGNTLRYTNEDGTEYDIDLTPYIDDTNLARITSASLNPTTKLLTLTRDDTSTITVSLSALTDRANHTGTQLASTISDFDTEVSNNSSVTANTAKVSNANHTGEVTGDTALTVQPLAISNKTLKASPAGTEEILINDAGTLKKTTISNLGGSVFGSEYHTASSEGSSSNNTGGWLQKLRLTTGSLPLGNYFIQWYFEHKGSGRSEGRVQLNDTTTLCQVDIDSSTPDFLGQGGHYNAEAISGVQNIDIDWQDLSGDADIRRARLTIWRVS